MEHITGDTLTLNPHGVDNAHAGNPVWGLRGHERVYHGQSLSVDDEDVLVLATAQQPATASHPG